MAIVAKFENSEFGVGDRVNVVQKIIEGGGKHTSSFEGTVIAIRGRGESKTFTVRKIGVQQIGIERIFPLNSPATLTITVVRKGVRGVRRAKLFYTRKSSKRELEKIFSRASMKEGN